MYFAERLKPFTQTFICTRFQCLQCFTIGKSGGEHNASNYVSVIRRLMLHTSFVLFTLTIHPLSDCRQLVPASAIDWLIKGHAMCYHVYVIIHVKDPRPSVLRVGHFVPLAGFCLSLYSLHVLNRGVNMI